MTRYRATLDPMYFEEMFRGSPDPWDLETSAYEQAKFDHSIAALAGRKYQSGFEVGCAKGILTMKLAARCASLLSIDVSETALAAARERLRQINWVVLERMVFPREVPDGQYDLTVWSEVAYYWDDEDLGRAADWLASHLAPGGDLLLVHYTGETDYPQSGDEAVTKLFHELGPIVTVVKSDRLPLYRLDLWRRVP